MTTPTIVSTRYTGTQADYRNCKADHNGASRTEYFTVTVPTATPIGTIIGLVPFQLGAKYSYESTFFTDALGAGVTCTLGYVYDTTQAALYTDAPAAFGTAQSLATAGNITGTIHNVRTGMVWKAGMVPASVNLTQPSDAGIIANGWIAITTAGAATSAAGVIDGQISMFYDQP